MISVPVQCGVVLSVAGRLDMAQTLTNEFWLISAPGEKTCQQTWEILNNVTSKQNSLSVNHKFHVPDLKVKDFILAQSRKSAKFISGYYLFINNNDTCKLF